MIAKVPILFEPRRRERSSPTGRPGNRALADHLPLLSAELAKQAFGKIGRNGWGIFIRYAVALRRPALVCDPRAAHGRSLLHETKLAAS